MNLHSDEMICDHEEQFEDMVCRLGSTLAAFVGYPQGMTSPLTGVHAEFQRRIRAQQLFMESSQDDAGHLTKEAEFFKTSLCSFYSKGKPCPKGRACTYAHGVHELRTFKVCVLNSNHFLLLYLFVLPTLFGRQNYFFFDIFVKIFLDRALQRVHQRRHMPSWRHVYLCSWRKRASLPRRSCGNCCKSCSRWCVSL
jgi:hypothetical protein